AGLDLEAHAGLAAIRAYLTSTAEIRFIQSFKSHIASPIFQETGVFGRRLKFEDLLAIFFRRALADANGAIDPAGAPGVSGRPVPCPTGRGPRSAMAKPIAVSASPRRPMSTSRSARRFIMRSGSRPTRWSWSPILVAAPVISR